MMDAKKQLKVIVPDEWSNDQRGAFLEGLVSDLLRKLGYKAEPRVRFTGMEIDVLADNLLTRQRAFVECKFIKEPFSADIITKLLGAALVVHKVPLAYLFSTAPPSKEAKGLIDQLEAESDSQQGPRFAFVGPEKITNLLMEVKGIKLPDLSKTNIQPRQVGSITLLVLPDDELYWVVEENSEGMPFRANIFPTLNNSSVEVERLRAHFLRLDFWPGLEIVDRSRADIKSVHQSDLISRSSNEIITSIPMADSFNDYRPCRPGDFVGRVALRNKVLEFSKSVRDDKTSTRVICFSGPSGFGKSSFVLKLKERFQNKKWRKKFYLFPIDVRSAKGALFVAQAIKTAIQQAIDDGFIDLPNHVISVESTETLLSSSSIQEAIDKLRSSRRVLVIFFDQFEELFSKESLFPIFEAFRRLAFEIDSQKSNLVLGFCWRTGIHFPGNHPAYHTWHNLKDRRLEFELSIFDGKESSLLLSQLEKHLHQPLDRHLKRRLLEKCGGLPWLIKKLFIHIDRQITKGIKQVDLVAQRLNIETLFQEDFEALAPERKKCIAYIAKNSPADSTDVIERFGHDVVNWLYSERLIIQPGYKYALYWDIFRDYVLTGAVPPIPLTHIPQTQLATAMKSFLLLQKAGQMDFADLSQKLGYSPKTLANVISDLQSFFLVNRKQSSLISVQDDLESSSLSQVADYLAKQLREHVLFRLACDQFGTTARTTVEEFRELFVKAYPAANFRSRTWLAYTNRILPWLKFAGLVEVNQQNIVIKPNGDGRQKTEFGGRLSWSRDGSGKGTFFCSSSLAQAMALATILAKQGLLDQQTLLSQGFRNAATDLICLGLATRTREGLISSQDLRALPKINETDSAVYDLIKARASSSFFLSSLNEVMEANPAGSLYEWGSELSKLLNRQWSPASAKRYITAGRTWLRLFSDDAFFKEPKLPRSSSQIKPARTSKFLCGSTPQRAVLLATQLVQEGLLDQAAPSARKYERSANDLIGLGLALRTSNGLVPAGDLLDLDQSENLDVKVIEHIKAKALESQFIISLRKAIASNPQSRSQLASTLNELLGRGWSAETADRSVSVGGTWLRFLEVDGLQTPSLFN